MSIYGALITDTAVENRVRDHLSAWMPSYLTEIARQESFGAIAFPKSIETIRDRVTRWNEQALPAVVVQIGGTVRMRRTGAKYRATYGATIGGVVSGQTRQNTRELAGIYALALAGALVQHGDLDGFADGCEWTDTDYSYIAEDRSRTIIAAVVSIDISVNDVMDASAGPNVPDPIDTIIPGLPDYGDAEHVIIDELIVPITDTLETT